MAQSLLKFFAVWFGFAAIVGAVLFFTSGDGSSLNPAIEDAMLKNCQVQSSGFSQDQGQQCLEEVAQNVLARALDVRLDLMKWYVVSAFVVLIIGLLFVVRVRQRSETAASPSDFRSMRGPWFVHMLLIGLVAVMFAVLAHFGEFFSSWGANLTQARGLGIPTFLVVSWSLSFWLGTLFSTPIKMKPSIPGS